MLLVPLAIVVTVAGVGAIDDELAELARMIRNECIEQSGVDPALLQQVDQGAALMPDPRLKCYIKCTMETAGMLSEGVVDVEGILGVLPAPLRDHLAATVRACATRPGADHCDVAYQTQLCWQNANKEHYMLI